MRILDMPIHHVFTAAGLEMRVLNQGKENTWIELVSDPKIKKNIPAGYTEVNLKLRVVDITSTTKALMK